MGTAQPSDAELLARLRSGDSAASAAFTLLRERYTRPVGLPVVRLGAERLDEVPEGLRGEPPDGLGPDERAIVLDAYATLPERMRAVLWLTEVEGCPAGVVGTVLGMTPAAAAALAFRARDQLRHNYLRTRLHASPRPRCGRPHPSRLAGYVRHRGRDGVRTAAAAHVDGCSSCRALVVAVGDAPRLFARVLVPWSASPGPSGSAATAAAHPSRSPKRPVGAIAAAGRHGRHAAALARGDPSLTGTVAVAAALVVALLAAAFLPGRSPADVASPSPSPPQRAAPADEGVIVPDLPVPPPPAADPPPTPATTVPGPVAARPADPAAEAPPPSVPPEAIHAGVDTRATPPSTAPSPAAPPTTVARNDAVVDAAAAPSVPSVSSAVWRSTSSQVEVTLVNGGVSSTGFLVMTLEAAGGALVGVQPTGCALALGMVTSGVCALRPLGPGASAVVRVPMTVTRPGQSAEVHVCAVGFLRLGCETPLLARTVVALA